MSHRHEIDDAITETRDLTRQMERRLDKMETILMVREPTSQAAADAYDGLRRQVISALQERHGHVTQLVQFASALDDGADTAMLGVMVRDWLESSNINVVSDSNIEGADLLFHVIENLGGPAEVLAPAYVDTATNRIIRQGRIRYAQPSPAATTYTGLTAAIADGNEESGG